MITVGSGGTVSNWGSAVGVALVRAQPAKSAAAASTSQNVLRNFRVFMRFILPEARHFAIIKCLRMKAAGLVHKPEFGLKTKGCFQTQPGRGQRVGSIFANENKYQNARTMWDARRKPGGQRSGLPVGVAGERAGRTAFSMVADPREYFKIAGLSMLRCFSPFWAHSRV